MYTYVCRVPTIAEYLYLIATLRYSNDLPSKCFPRLHFFIKPSFETLNLT